MTRHTILHVAGPAMAQTAMAETGTAQTATAQTGTIERSLNPGEISYIVCSA